MCNGYFLHYGSLKHRQAEFPPVLKTKTLTITDNTNCITCYYDISIKNVIHETIYKYAFS